MDFTKDFISSIFFIDLSARYSKWMVLKIDEILTRDTNVEIVIGICSVFAAIT